MKYRIEKKDNQQNKNWLFEKITGIDKHLTRLVKQKGEKDEIIKIRNERGNYYQH